MQAAGNVKPCIVADLLEEGSGRKDAERYRHEVKHVAGVAYEGEHDAEYAVPPVRSHVL